VPLQPHAQLATPTVQFTRLAFTQEPPLQLPVAAGTFIATSTDPVYNKQQAAKEITHFITAVAFFTQVRPQRVQRRPAPTKAHVHQATYKQLMAVYSKGFVPPDMALVTIMANPGVSRIPRIS
jgi:hypothetical protein